MKVPYGENAPFRRGKIRSLRAPIVLNFQGQGTTICHQPCLYNIYHRRRQAKARFVWMYTRVFENQYSVKFGNGIYLIPNA